MKFDDIDDDNNDDYDGKQVSLWKVFCSPDKAGLLHTIQTAAILKVVIDS